MSRSHKLDLREVEVSPDGRYVRFEEKLGSGAYKEVYLCYDTETGKECAWNTVQLGRIPESEKRRIIMETEILASLHHPHIINFYHVWENPQLDQICLTGDHRVLTRRGWRSIARVQEGEEVMSFNVDTLEQEWKPVLAVISHAVNRGEDEEQDDTLYRMQGSNMDIIATRDHRMLIARLAATGLQKREKAVDYETVGQLKKLTYTVSFTSSVPRLAHSEGRAVICSGTIRQPPVKIVIPGLERVCERWWRRDTQRRFLQFLGLWLGDGFLDPANGLVCLGQKKEGAVGLFEKQLLLAVFPGWWRRHSTSRDRLHHVYTIRCPPLYNYLRLMAVGPLGYNPRDPTQLRAYPHFTKNNELAEEELRSAYYRANNTSGCIRAWTEDAMLAAARHAAEPECCWWCNGGESEEDKDIVLCDGEDCQRGGHLRCAGLTAVPADDWFCPDCDSAQVQVEGVARVVEASDLAALEGESQVEEDAVIDEDDVLLVKEIVDQNGQMVRIPRAEAVVDEIGDEKVVREMRAAGKIVWWNNGWWSINGQWFYLKRWLGDEQQIANVFGRLSREQAIALLEGYCRADGYCSSIQYEDDHDSTAPHEPTGQWRCTNSSFPLIDHLMLIGQLAGAAVDLSLYTEAAMEAVIDDRTVTLSSDHWLVTFSFTKCVDVPFQTASLAEPVDVSHDVNGRGYYQYNDDGKVYCLTVFGNTNFLTQRLCRKMVGSGNMGIQAHSVFTGNCFTTEIVTSGTLKEYTSRVKNIKLKVIKKCQQPTTHIARRWKPSC